MKELNTPRPTRAKRRLGILIAWGIGIACIYFLARHADPRAFRSALQEVTWVHACGILVFSTLAKVLQGVRFWTLYPAGLSLRRHILQSFAIRAGNTVLPLRAGEGLRLLFLQKAEPNASIATHVSWTLVDKVVEMFAFVLFGLGAWKILHSDDRFARLQLSADAFVWGPILLGALAIGVTRIPRVRVWLGDMPSTSLLVKTFLWSVLFWSSNALVFYFSSADWRLALPLLISGSLASAIPSLPGGLGSFQGGYVAVTQVAGIPYNTALAQSVVSLGLQFLPTLAIGLPALWLESRRKD